MSVCSRRFFCDKNGLMKKIAFSLFIGVSVCCFFSLTAKSAPQQSQAKSFTVFDNLHFVERPDTAQFGIANCNIVYGYGRYAPKDLQDRKSQKIPAANELKDPFQKAVREAAQKPGPVVLDIEQFYFKGKPEVVKSRFDLFVNLTRWAQEAAPGRAIGWYGHGLFPNPPGAQYGQEASQLATTVNAFFPSMYTFNDDRAAWEKKARSLVAEAHKIAPGKPVYFYIWPQYHNGTPKGLQFLSGDYWLWQLETARKVGADGVVMWSSGKPAWNPNTEWWKATLKFLKESKPR